MTNDYSTILVEYDELMIKGKFKFDNIKKFNIACKKIVLKFLELNDFIHANNILQVYKQDVEEYFKQPWYIEASIHVYGKRTPLFFIQNPKVLFDKIKCVNDAYLYYKKNDLPYNNRINSTIKELFNYYQQYYCNKDSFFVSNTSTNEFVKQFTAIFMPYFNENKNILGTEIENIITAFNDYIEKPNDYFMPGVQQQHDESEINIIFDDIDDVENIKIVVENNNIIEEDSEFNLSALKNKNIVLLGSLRNDIKTKFLKDISKKFNINFEHYEYDRLKNFDITNLKNKKKYFTILVGPTPHKGRGIGNNSSILEALKSEGGYPRVFECRANSTSNELKFSTSSIKRILEQCNYYAISLGY